MIHASFSHVPSTIFVNDDPWIRSLSLASEEIIGYTWTFTGDTNQVYAGPDWASLPAEDLQDLIDSFTAPRKGDQVRVPKALGTGTVTVNLSIRSVNGETDSLSRNLTIVDVLTAVESLSLPSIILVTKDASIDTSLGTAYTGNHWLARFKSDSTYYFPVSKEGNTLTILFSSPGSDNLPYWGDVTYSSALPIEDSVERRRISVSMVSGKSFISGQGWEVESLLVNGSSQSTHLVTLSESDGGTWIVLSDGFFSLNLSRSGVEVSVTRSTSDSSIVLLEDSSFKEGVLDLLYAPGSDFQVIVSAECKLSRHAGYTRERYSYSLVNGTAYMLEKPDEVFFE